VNMKDKVSTATSGASSLKTLNSGVAVAIVGWQ
jgi:hypothetical protein